MKFLTGGILLLLSFINTEAQQKLFTKTGIAVFFSKAPIENIEAKNNKLFSVWDVSSGQIEFSILMKGFAFDKALMQEHFNENYVESDKYPKAFFKGVMENPKNISLDKDGTYLVKVIGMLTLHGITRQITVPAKIEVKNKIISASTTFTLQLAEYKIKIPRIVSDNISKSILINILVPSFQPLTPH
ncbi:MAG: YceI family protein [Ferruginibacter sp.]